MGGQACVLYGAAEFSRDTDFAILADSANLTRLSKALADLDAQVIAVPPFRLAYLRRGHAVHFRCHHPDAARMRIDVMSRMRGVDPFPKLWARRTTVTLPDGFSCDLLSLPDLVKAKKTQRDRDWPVIRRLIETHYFQHRHQPTSTHATFWLRELRTPQLLVEVARAQPALCRRIARVRPLVALASEGRLEAIEEALREEEILDRARDRQYWIPLRKELERLRHPR